MRTSFSLRRSRCVACGGLPAVPWRLLLLPLPATGSEVPSALAVANLPRFDLEANGNDHPLDGSYLAAPGEEAKDAEKYPLNAELLTMLLLAVSFGLSVGWLLRNAQRQGALCSLAVVRSSLATTCEDLPFLASGLPAVRISPLRLAEQRSHPPPEHRK